ncbi:hypothetical protein ABZ769_16480 [Streptomyces olivoreticuli]
MRFRLADDVFAQATGEALAGLPHFSVTGGSVAVGGYSDPQTREQQVGSTFGSLDWLWSGDDELRFRRGDGKLVGCLLQVPDHTAEVPAACERWTEVPTVERGLCVDPAQDFGFPPTDVRWIAPNGQSLVCLRQPVPANPKSMVRLRVAQNLDLLFTEDGYAGWLLESPAGHLAESSEFPAEVDDGRELARLFAEYFSIVSFPGIEKIQDEDPEARRELDELERDLLSSRDQSPQMDALLRAVRELIDEWYS